MIGRKTWIFGLAMLLGLAGSSKAQGVVPGGWSPEVGYQSFGGVTSGTGFGWYGGYPNSGIYGSGVYTAPVAPTYQAPPATVNNLGGLAGVVGRTTMTKTRRLRPR